MKIRESDLRILEKTAKKAWFGAVCVATEEPHIKAFVLGDNNWSHWIESTLQRYPEAKKITYYDPYSGQALAGFIRHENK